MVAGFPNLSDWMISVSAARELRAGNRLTVLRLLNNRFVDVTASWSPPPE